MNPQIVKLISDMSLIQSAIIFLSVLADKEGYDTESLTRVWKEMNERADAVTGKYLSTRDLATMLEEEHGIRIKGAENWELMLGELKTAMK